MAGVDAAINVVTSTKKKLGVTGGSGGGLLTNWVVDKRAALPQPSLSAISPVGKLVVHGGLHIVPAKTGFELLHLKIRTSIGCVPNQLHSQREDADDVYLGRS